MVIEIALGIVLAVIILAFLPQIYTAAVILVLAAIGIAIVAAIAAAIYFNWRVVYHTLGIGLAIVLAIGVPAILYRYYSRRWPRYRLLMIEQPTPDNAGRAWAVFGTKVATTITLLGIGICAGWVAVAVLDYVEIRIDNFAQQP